MGGRALRAALVVVGLLAAGGGWLWRELRPPATPVPPRGALLSDVTVVEPGRSRRPGRSIRIDGGRISSVGAAVADPGDPYRDRFALPGLVDMHVHHPPDSVLGDVELFGLLFLAHGVTTVRDTGNFDGTIFDTRKRIRDGAQSGPRIFACGPIIDGPPAFWAGSLVVESADEAARAVDGLARSGADCVKVYDHLSPEALRAVHAAAAPRRLPVIGHVPEAVGFREARLADVQHLTGLLDEDESTLSESRLRSVITTSAVLGIAHTPTLVVWRHLALLSNYERERSDPAARALPRYFRDVLWNPAHDARFRAMTPSAWLELGEAATNARRVVSQLHENGVDLFLGTDTMNPFVLPGASLHEEMREFEELGFSPEEVWAAATWRAGEALAEPLLGRIVAGAPADLLVFRDDPTRSLDALEGLEAVIADGRLYDRAALDAALAARRSHFERPLVEWISMRAVRWLAPPRGGRSPRRRPTRRARADSLARAAHDASEPDEGARPWHTSTSSGPSGARTPISRRTVWSRSRATGTSTSACARCCRSRSARPTSSRR